MTKEEITEFFQVHGEWCVSGGTLTVEQLYQAFKARLIYELMVDTHGAPNYGVLVPRPSQVTQTQGLGSVHDPVTLLSRSYREST
ncbi:MAG TPA: hypothetical protein VJA26_18630 [Gammaproteobacteria bacterium]|nr:hypothetical protein [Gammaproteobacteria bacterium]